MSDVSEEMEDESIDLNKEPVEGKGKRHKDEELTEEALGTLVKGGRNSRSVNAGKNARDASVDGGNESNVVSLEEVSIITEPMSKKPKKKGKRGRPRKADVDSEVSSSGKNTKGKNKVSKNDDDDDDRRGNVVKRRGRPPKSEISSTNGLFTKIDVNGEKNNDREKLERECRVKRAAEVDGDKLRNVVSKKKKMNMTMKHGDGGLREKKLLVKNQIVDMLKKAGWTIQYRDRQSREYQDAVYVDREGRTHWSVTLAYKKFKQKIDEGKAEEVDISAFNPIPEETFSMLFRTTVKGKKAGRKKKGGVKKKLDEGTEKDGFKVVKKEVLEEETSEKLDGGIEKKKDGVKIVEKVVLKKETSEKLDGGIKKGKDGVEIVKKKFLKKETSEKKLGGGIKKKKDGVKNAKKVVSKKETPEKLDGGIKKKGGVKIVTKEVLKNETSEKLDGGIKPRLNEGKLRVLSARKPKEGSESDGYELYQGKRTLLSWMIDMGTLTIGAKVKYRKGRGNKNMLLGKITYEGICCDCCNIAHSVQEFESHFKNSVGNSYRLVYLDSLGVSLFQCLVDSWKTHLKNDDMGSVSVDVDGDDPNDDRCNVCGDGGDLICCDSCPSTFHHCCLNTEVPAGDWNCVYCLCKFCGTMAADDQNLVSELLTCRLCEEKFHVHCATTRENFDDENSLFCGEECLKIHRRLQVLLGVKHKLENGFSCSVLRHRVLEGDSSSNVHNDLAIESNSKLAVAFSVMDECFEPIIDERTGTNIIHSVVYNRGSNIKRLNYNGFYTAILEKGDEIVCAASLRIHGTCLAEMPFIGTRYVYRRQGLCSKLLTGIKKVLCSLGVDKLVVPAISELNETWTKVFGFNPLDESDRLEMRRMSLIVFPGVDMLKKPMLQHHQSVENEIDSTVINCNEVHSEYQTVQENPAFGAETAQVKDGSNTESTTEAETDHKESDETAQVKDGSNTESTTEAETDHKESSETAQVKDGSNTESTTEAEADHKEDAQEVQNPSKASSNSDISSESEIRCNDITNAAVTPLESSQEKDTEIRVDNLEAVANDSSKIPLEVVTVNNDSNVEEEQSSSVVGNNRKRKKRGVRSYVEALRQRRCSLRLRRNTVC